MVATGEGEGDTIVVNGHETKHTRHGHHHFHHYEDDPNTADPNGTLKCALVCSCTLAMLAVGLVIAAICTNFWFSGYTSADGTDIAYTYGVLQDCYFEGQGESWDTQDDGWVCHKWEDTATLDHDVLTTDCKEGSVVGLAFSIIGILVVFPVAVIALIVAICFISDHRACFKIMHITCIALLCLGIFAFAFAPSFLAAMCSDMNERFRWVSYTGPFSNKVYAPLRMDMQANYSLILVIVALFITIAALVCYLYFFFEWNQRYVHHYFHEYSTTTHLQGDSVVVVNQESHQSSKKHRHSRHHNSHDDDAIVSHDRETILVDPKTPRAKSPRKVESPRKGERTPRYAEHMPRKGRDKSPLKADVIV